MLSDKALIDGSIHSQESVYSAPEQDRWGDLKARFADFKERVHKKGRERLTIMVIPHNEKSILNFHLSVYAISSIVAAIAVIMMVSIISLVGKSGEDLTRYGMGLDNKQFKVQSMKMAEEIIPLHDIIKHYSNIISELHVKLNGGGEELSGMGGVSQKVVDAEISGLKELIRECGESDSCDQEKTKEILRRIIYLSKQDNQSLKNAIALSERIRDGLKTPEKRNILKHTPSIWPTRGYLLSPYGWQVDQLLGKRVFKRGIEIGALPGSKVFATAPGYVSDVVYDPDYGVTVRIKHLYGMKTYYAHLDQVKIKKGEQVNKGQVIGYVGRSGNSPVYMLYYEVHVGTVAYNPHAFLNHLQDQWLIQPKPQ